MKRFLPFLIVILAAVALAACDSLQPESVDGTPAAVIVTSESALDVIGATDPATEPGVIVIEPVPPAAPEDGGSGLPDMPAGGSPASVETTGLPVVANVQVVPATPYDSATVPGPIGLPEHIRVDFTAEGQNPDAAKPVLYVIPAAEYAALWEAAGDMGVSGTLAGLQSLITDRLDPFPEAGIPVLPIERVGSAFNDLAVQGQYVDLDGLSGLRFVGRFVQAADPVSNQGLTYVFQGFTDDGEYYVSFLYPIETPLLPGDSQAVDPTELELFTADVDAYIAERVSMLNSLTDTDWSPNLSALDALLASLQIPGQATTDVVVEASPLTGQIWLWVRTTGASGETAAVDPARYTIVFNEDGTAVVQADCNTVLASYTTDNAGAITILLGPSTMAACPEDTQDQQFLSELGAARAYGATADNLSIEISEDRTTMQFAVSGEIAEGISTDVVGESFLTSGTWQWASTDDPLGSSAVANPQQYTITFNADGTAAIQADCNRVIASYTATDDGGMSIQLGPTTLAACAADSQDTQFLQGLAAVVFYVNNGGGLSMEMMADGGVMNFVLGSQEVIEPEGVPVSDSLVGKVWQWTALRQLNGETAVPEPSRYTVAFNADGTANIQADCNVVGATYQAPADGSLTVTLGPSTLALCEGGSLDQVFLGGLGTAQSYGVADGALSITLQNENGTMVLIPIN